MKELLSYVFSPLREGDIALYRGSGNGLAPILLVAAEETSLGCVERLEHEYALKAELDADWAARPVALTRYNDRMALVGQFYPSIIWDGPMIAFRIRRAVIILIAAVVTAAVVRHCAHVDGGLAREEIRIWALLCAGALIGVLLATLLFRRR